MNRTWLSLAITLAIQSMVSMALLTLPVMAPEVARALGLSTTMVGVYVALAYAGAMASSLVSGAAVGRLGAIRISQIGLVLCALGLALCAVPSVPAVAVGALLIGLGYGPVTPASSHLLARTTAPGRMSLVFSVKQTGVPLGGMLAGALVPGTMLLTGWQGALWWVAAGSLLCAVIAQPLRAELDADRDQRRPLALGHLAQPVRMVLSHKALSMLALCSFFFSAIQVSLTTYLVTFLHETLGFALVAAGLVMAVSQMAGVGGRIAWGYVADRFLGARRTLILLALLMAVAAVATAFLSPNLPLPVLMLVLGVFGASAIGWNGVYLAEVARQAPAGMASVATGGTLAVTFLGVVIGPAAFGALSGAVDSYRLGYAALAVPALLCGGLLWRQGRLAPKPSAGTAARSDRAQ
jgi:MFS family permease